MLFKESGYDEFLAEKIRKAEVSMNEGKGISLAEAKKHWRQKAEQRAKDIEVFEQQEQKIYG